MQTKTIPAILLGIVLTLSGYSVLANTDTVVHTGTVKFFNVNKRYGFIAPDKDGAEVFFRYSTTPELYSIREGQRVSYELLTAEASVPEAINLKLLK